MYTSWQSAEQSLRSSSRGISKAFNTPAGKRVVDCFSNKVIKEAKYGYQGLSQSIKNQIDKDIWLKANNGSIKKVEWHFYWSKVSKSGGPSGPLLKYLVERGIKVVFH